MKAFKEKILNKEPKNVAVSHHNCKLKISTYTTEPKYLVKEQVYN